LSLLELGNSNSYVTYPGLSGPQYFQSAKEQNPPVSLGRSAWGHVVASNPTICNKSIVMSALSHNQIRPGEFRQRAPYETPKSPEEGPTPARRNLGKWAIGSYDDASYEKHALPNFHSPFFVPTIIIQSVCLVPRINHTTEVLLPLTRTYTAVCLATSLRTHYIRRDKQPTSPASQCTQR